MLALLAALVANAPALHEPNRFLPGLETCSFLLPPHERVLAKLGRHGRTWTLACRGFGLPALLLGLARAARCPAQGGSRPRSLGGVKDGTTGQLAVPWRPRASGGADGDEGAQPRASKRDRSTGRSRCCISLAARIAYGACSGSGAHSTERTGTRLESTLPGSSLAPATAVQFLTCFSV